MSDAVLDLHAIAARVTAARADNDAARAYANDCAIDDAAALLAALRETRQALVWALPFARHAVLDAAANVYPAAVQNLQNAEAVLARCRDPHE